MTTELENLLAVFREVDRGLAADPRHTAAVAEVLPPYEHGAAIGWVHAVERWAAARPSTTRPVTWPSIEDALDALASTPPDPALRPRRVVALGALALARPGRFGPQGDDHARVVAALPGHDLDSTLEASIVRARSEGQLFARTVVRVEIPVPDLDPQQARDVVDRFLDPGNWPRLLPSRWNAMRPVDPGLAGTPVPLGRRRRYQEEFRVTDWLELTPVLELLRTDLLPGSTELAQCLEYRLVEGRPNEDDLVKRDSGALVAHFVDGILRIRTTKRVRFRPPFDGPGLAMFAGAVGYLDASEQMVLAAIAEADPSGAPHVLASR